MGLLIRRAIPDDDVMVDEAGHRAAVHPGLGAWLWMAAQGILLAGFLAGHGRDT